MDIRKQAGQNGETVAAAFLEKEGVRILMRNFRCKFGEIDLIGKDHDSFLVVEIKMRSTKRMMKGNICCCRYRLQAERYRPTIRKLRMICGM